VDFAPLIQEGVDAQYPPAEKIVLVLANLHTPTPASLSEAFAPAEARRVLERLERHDTPQQGSWWNMAETELRVLTTQCVDRRMPDPTTLRQEVAAWEQRRTQAKGTVKWRFTTRDARIKLKRLSPSMQVG
jgi:hypothetical protein